MLIKQQKQHKLRWSRVVAILLIITLPLAAGGIYYYKTRDTQQEEEQPAENLEQENTNVEGETQINVGSPDLQTLQEGDQITTEDAQAVSSLTISSWLAYWDQDSGIDSYNRAPEKYYSLSPTWYELQAYGSLKTRGNARDQGLRDLTRQYNTKLIPTIACNDENALTNILNNPQQLQNHINHISNEVTQYDYDGIDIDYEKIKSTDRDAFSNFIKQLAENLHSKSKLLTIAILPKNGGLADMFSSARQAQDWLEIGQHVDEFRIMAYDYTHTYQTAGPIAPADWVEEILEKAVEEVPREKIVLGVPLYAYQWEERQTGAKAIIWSSIVNIKSQNQCEEQFPEISREKYLKCNISGVTYEYYYQDKDTTQARREIAERYEIKGIIFWYVGGEDPGVVE